MLTDCITYDYITYWINNWYNLSHDIMTNNNYIYIISYWISNCRAWTKNNVTINKLCCSIRFLIKKNQIYIIDKLIYNFVIYFILKTRVSFLHYVNQMRPFDNNYLLSFLQYFISKNCSSHNISNYFWL